MDNERHTQLLLRQLRDIQAQADQIIRGSDSREAIGNFSKYSNELQTYVLKNVASAKIQSYISKLPAIKYDRIEVRWWQFIIMPIWWIALYNDYQSRKHAVEDIALVRGKYASLELMIKEDSSDT